jgi:hypothetical protein
MQEETTVCVVGRGPAGMILSLLLVRQGIRVTLLESHDDFDREFRGDTLHSTTMELMDELGLMERVEPLIHSKLKALTLVTPTETLDFVHLDWLKTPHAYVGLVRHRGSPQGGSPLPNPGDRPRRASPSARAADPRTRRRTRLRRRKTQTPGSAAAIGFAASWKDSCGFALAAHSAPVSAT